jgi:hypothetical protein
MNKHIKQSHLMIAVVVGLLTVAGIALLVFD